MNIIADAGHTPRFSMRLDMRVFSFIPGFVRETLAGLCGLGDLVLTCTSAQSRNFRYGLALGEGQSFDPSMTVEGAATAKAVRQLAKDRRIDMPIATVVADLVDGQTDVATALNTLLSRPLKEE